MDQGVSLIGFSCSLKRIITQEALSLGRITKSKQDRSHEFISILARILVVGKWIPPLLVYKGKSGDIQDTWVDKVTVDSKAHFTTLSNVWSNNAIGLL